MWYCFLYRKGSILGIKYILILVSNRNQKRYYMIILIGSQKGGCGKSTLAQNLAYTLASGSSHAEVLLVDADSQKTTTIWSQDRLAKPECINIPCIQISGEIRQTLKELSEKYEFVIVDIAGRDSVELRSGLSCADIFISPVRPAQFDLDTIPHLAEIFEKATVFNPLLIGVLVLNMCPTNPKVRESEEAIEYLQQYPNFHLATTRIHDRKAFRDSGSNGLSVLEWTDEKAAESILQFTFEIIEHAKSQRA
jgi:chromosome partitioning protein